jgi:hypothetical protein
VTVKRLTSRAAAYRVSPFGVALLVIVVAAIAVACIGPKSAQLPALLAAIVLAAVLTGGSIARPPASLEERRAKFAGLSRVSEDEPGESEDAELWRRERERYESADRDATGDLS